MLDFELILVTLSLLLFGAAGTLLVLWMRPDPRAHLRRCPGCGHDLRRTPGHKCVECGRHEPDELPFFRPRRTRWRLAGAIGLAAAGAFLLWLSSAQRSGWPSYLPSTALVPLYPEFDPPKGVFKPKVADRPLYVRLIIRLKSGQFSGWGKRWLAERLIGLARSTKDANLREEALGLIALCGPDAKSAVGGLITLSACGDPTTEAAARGALFQFDPSRPEVIAAIMGDPSRPAQFFPQRLVTVPYLRDDGSVDLQMQVAGTLYVEHAARVRTPEAEALSQAVVQAMGAPSAALSPRKRQPSIAAPGSLFDPRLRPTGPSFSPLPK